MALLLSGCQVAFPLDGYDEGNGSGGVSDAERCKAALFCEDFESGIAPSRWENVVTAGSVVEIDEARFHGGKRALHGAVVTEVPGQEAKAQLNHDQPLPEVSYVRFWTWVDPSSVDDVVIGVVMQGAGPFDGMNLRVTPLGLVTLTNWAEEPDANYDGVTSVPPDRWVCLEWSIDRTTGAISVEQDGVSSVGVTASTITSANWLQVGALLTQPVAGEASEVWIDDLVVDTKPIGCD